MSSWELTYFSITKFHYNKLISEVSRISLYWYSTVFRRLYQHINQNNILATEQYGFRNNSSTEKAFSQLINEILQEVNIKLTFVGIFFDLEKAFDSINHDYTIVKMWILWIQGQNQWTAKIIPQWQISESTNK